MANIPPNRKAGISAVASVGVTVNNAYALDLSTIFEDADGGPLAYAVNINGGGYAAATQSYSYTPNATGTVTLVFKANDGTVDSSDTYTVPLTVNARSNNNDGSSGSSGSSAKTTEAVRQTEYIIDATEMRRLIAAAKTNGWDFARASSDLPITIKAAAWKLPVGYKFVSRSTADKGVSLYRSPQMLTLPAWTIKSCISMLTTKDQYLPPHRKARVLDRQERVFALHG